MVHQALYSSLARKCSRNPSLNSVTRTSSGTRMSGEFRLSFNTGINSLFGRWSGTHDIFIGRVGCRPIKYRLLMWKAIRFLSLRQQNFTQLTGQIWVNGPLICGSVHPDLFQSLHRKYFSVVRKLLCHLSNWLQRYRQHLRSRFYRCSSGNQPFCCRSRKWEVRNRNWFPAPCCRWFLFLYRINCLHLDRNIPEFYLSRLLPCKYSITFRIKIFAEAQLFNLYSVSF